MPPPERLRDIEEPDLHWLAGLLEGEGTFLCAPPSAPRSPAIQMWMTDHDVVGRAADLFDVKRLRPLMGMRRQQQIDRAVATYAPDPRRRLSEARAQHALVLLARGESVREVAERLGTSIWCIYDLRLGRTHRHLERPEPA